MVIRRRKKNKFYCLPSSWQEAGAALMTQRSHRLARAAKTSGLETGQGSVGLPETQTHRENTRETRVRGLWTSPTWVKPPSGGD